MAKAKLIAAVIIIASQFILWVYALYLYPYVECRDYRCAIIQPNEKGLSQDRKLPRKKSI